jgi:hypothetical protein
MSPDNDDIGTGDNNDEGKSIRNDSGAGNGIGSGCGSESGGGGGGGGTSDGQIDEVVVLRISEEGSMTGKFNELLSTVPLLSILLLVLLKGWNKVGSHVDDIKSIGIVCSIRNGSLRPI